MLTELTSNIFRCKSHLLDLRTPVVMGILNVTPDSFYASSRIPHDPQKLTELAGKMIEEGALILDVGGLSTRPGSVEISVQEEIDRILPAIEILSAQFPETILSIDTYRHQVAEVALHGGASIVNDISGFEFDNEIIRVVKKFNAGYVLMHSREKPETMQNNTDYQNLMQDILKYFVSKVKVLYREGIRDILVDPGFGFAKTPEQNYKLIQELGIFRFLNHPVMVGVSRKSTLSKTIERPTNDTLHATTALHMAALMKGAKVLRVHDVREAMDTIAVFLKLNEAKSY